MGVYSRLGWNRKDDYVFFIHPVDPVQVPGYADMIKNPMDLGMMTVKVTKGTYCSLEEFTVCLDWSHSQCSFVPCTTNRLQSASDDEWKDIQSSWTDLLQRS